MSIGKTDFGPDIGAMYREGLAHAARLTVSMGLENAPVDAAVRDAVNADLVYRQEVAVAMLLGRIHALEARLEALEAALVARPTFAADDGCRPQDAMTAAMRGWKASAACAAQEHFERKRAEEDARSDAEPVFVRRDGKWVPDTIVEGYLLPKFHVDADGKLRAISASLANDCSPTFAEVWGTAAAKRLEAINERSPDDAARGPFETADDWRNRRGVKRLSFILTEATTAAQPVRRAPDPRSASLSTALRAPPFSGAGIR